MLLRSSVLRIAQSLFVFFSVMPLALSHADSHLVKRTDVKKFMHMMVQKHKFKKQRLIYLFTAVKIRPQIIQRMNKPLEREPWHTYQRIFVSQSRIQKGVKFWNKYATTLKKAENVFGVPSSIIVATIGIETKYGENIGEFRVIDSLSNLAFSNSTRAAFFRKELEHFLILTRDNRLDPLKVMGSYAGAIGQPQFMPSSYRYYAVNFSKSGRTDLMHNEVDVIGSIANYYKKHGWTPREPIAVQALMIGDRYHYLKRKAKIIQPLHVSELIKFGIVPKSQIKPETLKVKVIELESHYSKEYWLGFHNFDVIRRYNASDLYAMAVYQLSNYISELKERSNHG